MGIKSRVTQDQRNNSRVIARLDCRFTYEGDSYDGTLVDLSMKGAMIMTSIQPPAGKEISITVQSNLSKNPMILIGKVLRGSWVTTDYGKRGRFAVRFINTPLDLFKLLGQLQ